MSEDETPPDLPENGRAQRLVVPGAGTRTLSAGGLFDEIRAVECSEGEDYRPVNPALAEAADHAMGAPETWGVRELGYRLRTWSGRIVNGLRLVHDGKGKQGVRWR